VINPNYKEINATQVLADENSIYHYYKAMLALRKKVPAFVYGDYKDIDPQHPSVFAYTRTLGTETFLILLNFSRSKILYTLLEGFESRIIVSFELGCERRIFYGTSYGRMGSQSLSPLACIDHKSFPYPCGCIELA
jgi:glycosidase